MSAILDLLRHEHAVLWAEAQAKISDVRWKSVPARVDPHHMTVARSRLLARNRIAIRETRTKGGYNIGVLHLRDTAGIATAVDTAAARKRALMATLHSWLNPRSGYPLGFVGAAGERVTHSSLLEAAPYGLRLERPDAGEVRCLLGEEVEGGPFDNAAWVQVTNSIGAPVEVVLCPIEVKNIRHWIYPSASELHQLLHKAALLQRRHEDLHVCPVLVTRKKSYSANAMSRDLGFRILDVNRQFVLPVAEVDRDALSRIRTELGFSDLVAHDGADPALVRALQQLSSTALTNAMHWRRFGPELVDHFETLRENLTPSQRHAAMEELHDAVRELGGDARW